MVDLQKCQYVAQSLQGEIIVAVTYVGLDSKGKDLDWDFGDWHWPEVGVEFKMRSGRKFFAIWDFQVTNYELTLAEGTISEQWLPLREDTTHARLTDVSQHFRWKPFIGTKIESCSVAPMEFEHGLIAPISVRLAFGKEAVWVVAASPRNHETPRCASVEDINMGADEIMLLFGDELADCIGLADRIGLAQTLTNSKSECTDN